MPELMNN